MSILAPICVLLTYVCVYKYVRDRVRDFGTSARHPMRQYKYYIKVMGTLPKSRPRNAPGSKGTGDIEIVIPILALDQDHPLAQRHARKW